MLLAPVVGVAIYGHSASSLRCLPLRPLGLCWPVALCVLPLEDLLHALGGLKHPLEARHPALALVEQEARLPDPCEQLRGEVSPLADVGLYLPERTLDELRPVSGERLELRQLAPQRRVPRLTYALTHTLTLMHTRGGGGGVILYFTILYFT